MEFLLGLLAIGYVIGLPVVALVALVRTQRIAAELAALRRQLGAAAAASSAGPVAPAAASAAPKAAAEPRPAPARIIAAEVPVVPIAPREVPPAAPAVIPTAPRESPPASLAAAPAPQISPAAAPTPTAEPASSGHIALEERVGARIFVWIGGVALALAGAFLVKYSIDAGLLGPGVRVMLGILLGALLLGAGEVMRSRSTRIAQALSAAGIADLYASLFAAVSLYQLLSPAVGFALLALLTAGAIALSLRQGPFIALVGLAGGFLTPALVASDRPSAAILFGYLLLLQAGAQVVVRRRGWRWLAAVAVSGGLLWVAIWLLAGERFGGLLDHAAPGLFLLATVALTGWAAREAGATPGPLRYLEPAVQAAALMLMAGLVLTGEYATLDWLLFGLLSALLLWRARREPADEPMLALAALLGLLLLGGWPVTERGQPIEFIRVTVGLGGLFAVGGFLGLWQAAQPLRWAALSALSTVAYFAVSHLQLRALEGLPAWGLVSLALAALHLAAAERLARRRTVRAGYNDSLGIHALAVTGLIAIAIGLGFDDAWLATAWSLQLSAIAWVEQRLDIPWLRRGAWVAGALVLFRLIPGLALFGQPRDTTPLLNWILYGYGLPMLGFAAAAWLFRRRADDHLARALEAGAALIAFLLVTLEIRHLFHAGDWRSDAFDLRELAALTNAWLLLGLALLWLARRFARQALGWSGRAVLSAAAAALVLGALLVLNPLLGSQPVGTWPLVNLLIPVYALPALLLLLAARELRRSGQVPAAAAAAGLGILLGFAFVSLEIRHVFHRDDMSVGAVGVSELATLINVWLLIGLGLLHAAPRGARPALLWGGRTALAVAAIALVVGALGTHNPLLAPVTVGTTPLANLLVPAYALPALLLVLAGREFDRLGDTRTAWAAIGLAIVTGFAFVTLEVRHWFHRDLPLFGAVPDAETYAYSAVWILYGGLLLAAGIFSGGRALRYASLVVIVVAVGKVFLIDAGQLTGLIRVGSFFGLGISLLVIGYIYQRFVFRRPAVAAT